MIVYTRDDTVKLSGALTRNQWPTIKAAARVLMKEHPEGILIDGGELTTVTPEGARTFLDALRDIEAVGARMVVCNIPPAVMAVLRGMPGLRSQVAFSMSVEEARESLRSAGACSIGLPLNAILVPVLSTADTAAALRLASVSHRDRGLPVGIVGFVVVPRELPVSSPLPEEEAQTQELLGAATAEARRLGLACTVHVERVREIKDGLLATIAAHEAAMVVLALRMDRLQEEDFLDLASHLLRRAPCEVLIARVAGKDSPNGGPTTANGRGPARAVSGQIRGGGEGAR